MNVIQKIRIVYIVIGNTKNVQIIQGIRMISKIYECYPENIYSVYSYWESQNIQIIQRI